jgi:hypothetical protein
MINHNPFVLLCGLEGRRTERQWIRAGTSDLDRILETVNLADPKGDERMLGFVCEQYTGTGGSA